MRVNGDSTTNAGPMDVEDIRVGTASVTHLKTWKHPLQTIAIAIAIAIAMAELTTAIVLQAALFTQLLAPGTRWLFSAKLLFISFHFILCCIILPYTQANYKPFIPCVIHKANTKARVPFYMERRKLLMTREQAQKVSIPPMTRTLLLVTSILPLMKVLEEHFSWLSGENPKQRWEDQC